MLSLAIESHGHESSVVHSGAEALDRVAAETHVVVLMVSDNGVGFPEDLDLRTTETLGLELVRTLVDQLEGTLEGTSAGGAGTPVPGTGASSAPAGTSGTAFNITFADSEASNEIR